MFLSAEERPWWDAKLLHSFAAVGSSGKTAQPGICHSSMEAPCTGLGEGVRHSLCSLDFSVKHAQSVTTMSGWATTG